MLDITERAKWIAHNFHACGCLTKTEVEWMFDIFGAAVLFGRATDELKMDYDAWMNQPKRIHPSSHDLKKMVTHLEQLFDLSYPAKE